MNKQVSETPVKSFYSRLGFTNPVPLLGDKKTEMPIQSSQLGFSELS